MKIYIIFFFLITSACSQYSTSSNQPINFKYSKEIISNLDSLEPKISDHLFNTQRDRKKEIFSNSWVSFIKANQEFNNEIVVEIKEHQPIAILSNNRFLTQSGRIISPQGHIKDLRLISILGSDEELSYLLSYARLMQNVLNLKGDYVKNFNHIGSNFIEVEDNQGTKYSFTKGDFRVQLERLEQFILFELNSGKIDNSRYIDLRYKNAIAVSDKKMEKRI